MCELMLATKIHVSVISMTMALWLLDNLVSVKSGICRMWSLSFTLSTVGICEKQPQQQQWYAVEKLF